MTEDQTIIQNQTKIDKEKHQKKRQREENPPALGHGQLRRIAKWAGITVGTLWLYRWGAEQALAQRGYYACGGELLLLMIPLLYYIIEKVAAGFARDIREFWTEDEEEEE